MFGETPGTKPVPVRIRLPVVPGLTAKLVAAVIVAALPAAVLAVPIPSAPARVADPLVPGFVTVIETACVASPFETVTGTVIDVVLVYVGMPSVGNVPLPPSVMTARFCRFVPVMVTFVVTGAAPTPGTAR